IDDVPALLPLVEGYWEFEGISGFDATRVPEQLARLFSDPRLGCGWVAFLDGHPVGYLLAVYVFSLEHLGLTAEIDEFMVFDHDRVQGVGSGLLRIAESTSTQAGCTKVSLQLSRRNDSGRAFYHRQGYSERSGYELLDKALQDG